jgi:glycosyltransferase involved in cell wall biosynthesis
MTGFRQSWRGAPEVKPVLLLVGPFPPPYGGIANITAQLAGSDLNDAFRIVPVNVNLPSEETENTSGKKRVNLWKAARLYLVLTKALLSTRPAAAIVEMNGDKSCFREMIASFFIRLSTRATVVTHFHGGMSQRSAWRTFPFSRKSAETFSGRFFLNLCFSFSHHVACLSRHLVEDMRPFLSRRVGAKLAIVENFVVTRDFRPHEDPRDGRTRVLFMGRLSLAKGFFDLLQAIPGVAEKHPGVVFWACGAPETSQSLDGVNDLMRDFEAKGWLRLLGIVKGEQKQVIYARADILACPSHGDVFPVTLLEGLAQGLPIVTTRVGDIPYLVTEPENVLFTEKGCISSLVDGLLFLLENPEVRKTMGLANRTLARARFDIDVATSRFRGLLSTPP